MYLIFYSKLRNVVFNGVYVYIIRHKIFFSDIIGIIKIRSIYKFYIEYNKVLDRMKKRTLESRLTYIAAMPILTCAFVEAKTGASIGEIVPAVSDAVLTASTIKEVVLVETAKQGIIDLVSVHDAFKFEASYSFYENIKKTSELLPSYIGNLKTGYIPANGQRIINASTNDTRLFFSSLSSPYHFYFNSYHIIFLIPLIMINLCGLFARSCNIIHSIFLQAFSLFLKILWEPNIKKTLPYVRKTTEAKWNYWIHTNEFNKYESNQVSAGNNGGNNGGSNDGNGDKNNRSNSPNFYEKIPKALLGLIELLKDIISTLEYLSDFLKWILRLRSVSTHIRNGVGLNPVEHRVMWYISMIEKGQLGFRSNFWRDYYSNFYENLLISIYTLGIHMNLFNIIALTIEGLDYESAELGNLLWFFYIRQNESELIQNIIGSILAILPHLEEQLAILENMIG